LVSVIWGKSYTIIQIFLEFSTNPAYLNNASCSIGHSLFELIVNNPHLRWGLYLTPERGYSSK